jgi:hypothetical protein
MGKQAVALVEMVRNYVDEGSRPDLSHITSTVVLSEALVRVGYHAQIARGLNTDVEAMHRALIHAVELDKIGKRRRKKLSTCQVELVKNVQDFHTFLASGVATLRDLYESGAAGVDGEIIMGFCPKLTPLMGAAILKCRRNQQRPISKDYVRYITEDMKAEKFSPIGESIKFSVPDGNVVDGQTRMVSLLVANAAIYNVIFVIIPNDEWIRKIDSQGKPKNPQNISVSMGETPVPPTVAAAVILETTDFCRAKLSSLKRYELVRAHPYTDLGRQLYYCGGAIKPIGPFVAGALRCARDTGDEEEVSKFFGHAFSNNYVIDGVKSVQAKLVYDQMSKLHGTFLTVDQRREWAQRIILIWNRWRRGGSSAASDNLPRLRKERVTPKAI